MKFYKILFFSSMLIGTLLSISSNSWLGMWMGLEINLLSIIPLMNNSENKFSSEASIKYFITQALASTMLMFSIILMSNNAFLNNKSLIIIMNSALLTKSGAAPFHFWFPEVMEGLTWMNCLIIMTMSKIAPMILIMNNMNFPMFFYMIIITCMLVSSIMGFNQTSLRKILAYSSINHLGWMLSSMFILKTTWIYYFLIYSFITINIILILKTLNIFNISQLIMAMNNNLNNKFFFSMNFLSLGGLPPFIGFLPKWLVIQELMKMKIYFLTLTMTLLTLMTLFIYIRLLISILIMTSTQLNFTSSSKSFSYAILNLNIFSASNLILCTFIFNLI